MLKHAYESGLAGALDRFDVKDAGLRERMMPLMLAAGIGGGGTAGAAAVKHMMPHHMAPMSQMAAPMAAPALPSFGGALQHETSRLDQILNAR